MPWIDKAVKSAMRLPLTERAYSGMLITLMKRIPPSIILAVLSAAVFLGVIGFAAYLGNRPSGLDTFAKCLTEKGARMYSTWWCPNCTAQKKAFGESFQYISNTECSDPGQKNQTQECAEAGIKSYPTWQFGDGTRETGNLPLDYLAEKTSCLLPSDGTGSSANAAQP